MFQGIQLHFESKGSFAGKQLLPLQIGIHHEQRRGVIIQVTDNGGDGFLADHLASSLASMPGDDLIAAFCSGTHNNRYEDSIALYALRCAFHMNIIYHMERMILEWVQLCQRQLNHLFRAISCMDCRIPIFILSGGTTLCLCIHFDFLLSFTPCAVFKAPDDALKSTHVMTQKGHLTLIRGDVLQGLGSCISPLFICRPFYTPCISVTLSGLFSRFGKG